MDFKMTLLVLVAVVSLVNGSTNKLAVRRVLAERRQDRVGMYGGKTTNIKKFPYVVGVLVDGNFTGQGCIIGKKWVLTTGDTVYGADASDITIVAASNNGITGTRFKADIVASHPKYDMWTFECEYAVVKIQGHFTWSSKIKPVKLPTIEPKVNSWLAVAGWGDTGTVTQNKVMKAGRMKWIDKSKCYNLIYDVDYDYSLGCAYNPGKTALCDGDWGDVYVQKGVVYGMFITGAEGGWCTSQAGGAVLADVHGGVSWIKKVTSSR